MNQPFSAHPSQSSRIQNQQCPIVPNGGMRGRKRTPDGLPVNNLPTPSYSPVEEAAFDDSVFAFDHLRNPFLPDLSQNASMGTSFRGLFSFLDL